MMEHTDRIAASGILQKIRWRQSLCLLMVLVAVNSGCSYTSTLLTSPHGGGAHHRFHVVHDAKIAWRRCHGLHRGWWGHDRDLKQGFVDGYVAVASGAGSCPPLFAPSSSCCGLKPAPDAASWFQGYTLGTIEAEKQG
ncbi:MAG: hypothetical protein ACO1RT_11770, partial [Planctomycetaceae bacterium]